MPYMHRTGHEPGSAAVTRVILTERLATLRAALERYEVPVAPEHYVQDYVTPSDSGGKYHGRSERFRQQEEQLKQQSAEVYQSYNRFLLSSLLLDFSVDAGKLSLPDSVKALYRNHLQRIEKQLDSFDSEFFSLDNDAFVKDLAILSHRLLPLGAELAAPGCGVPRSLLFRQGFSQFIGLSRCLLGLGGSSPLLALHMHILDTADFNPQGWLATYERLADLLELNPQYLGIQSTSWFLDPQLEDISPHLGYLRQVPLHCGAQLFFVGLDQRGESGALSKSAYRRSLFDNGEYVPALYTRIWSRADILARSWRQEVPAS